MLLSRFVPLAAAAVLLLGALTPAAAVLSREEANNITDVHVVYSNHLDVGFDGITPIPGTSANVINRYLNVYVPRALETAKNVSRDTNGAQQFTWMTQCWVISMYLDCPPAMGFRCPTPEQQDEARAAIVAGVLSWHAFPFNSELETYSADTFLSGIDLCHALDDEFKLPRKATLSQRDVPGMSRAVVPLLNQVGVSAISLGVNGFSAPPSIPGEGGIALWRDVASGTEVILQRHSGGYGGISASDAAYVPGLSHVLIQNWQGDNAGPHKSKQALADIAHIQSEFPNARVYASSFDKFFGIVSAQAKDALPVVTSEVADSWIWGIASDPLKNAQLRALQRVRDWCQHAEPALCEHSSPAYANFSRLLLKGGEHTWGGDTKLFLGAYHEGSDYFAWNNSDFQHRLQKKSHETQAMVSTWYEQRQWAITDALEALPEDHPVRAGAAAEFAQLRPEYPQPGAQGFVQHNLTDGPVRFQTADWAFFLCPMRGFIGNLTDRASGQQWSSGGEQPLGQLVYQTLTEADFTAFREAVYGMLEAEWAALDFGKKDLDALAHPQHQTDLKPQVKAIWSRGGQGQGQAQAQYEDQDDDAAAPLEILVQLAFAPNLVSDYGAPADTWVSLVLPASDAAAAAGGPSIDITLQLFNKTATRMPEALFYSFNPVRPWAADGEQEQEPGWLLSKLGSLVAAADVVLNGSQTLHALTGDAVLGPGPSARSGAAAVQQRELRVSSPDVTFVYVGPSAQLSALPLLDPSVHDPRTDALSFGLFNNLWGTNYVMWYPFSEGQGDENIKYRFSISVTNTSSTQLQQPSGPRSHPVRSSPRKAAGAGGVRTKQRVKHIKFLTEEDQE